MRGSTNSLAVCRQLVGRFKCERSAIPVEGRHKVVKTTGIPKNDPGIRLVDIRRSNGTDENPVDARHLLNDGVRMSRRQRGFVHFGKRLSVSDDGILRLISRNPLARIFRRSWLRTSGIIEAILAVARWNCS